MSNLQFFKVETTKQSYIYRESTSQIFLLRGSQIAKVSFYRPTFGAETRHMEKIKVDHNRYL